MKKQLSPTWILFASGNSVKVDLSLYDPAAERSRPIEAYMVSDVGSDLARSASRAAETIYAIAHTAKIAPPPTVVGYDLQGLGRGSHIAGQSSGLALALALAKKIWPDLDPGPIAATGEIAGSSNGGPLHKIAEIEAKGKAVISLLPDGGYFFYPKVNEAEISENLKQSWRENGIKAQAVASVAEALAFFIPTITGPETPKPEPAASITTPEKGNRVAFFLLVGLALMGVIGTAGLFYAIYQPHPEPANQTETPVTQATKESSPPANNPTPLPTPAKKVSQPAPPPEQKTPQIVSKAETGSINAAPSPPEATNPKTEIKTEIKTNKKVDKPTPAPQEFPEIGLTGTSGLADSLAQRTSSRLKAFLDSDRNILKQLQSVNGRIEIIEIRERWNSQTDSLSSTVTTAFHGRATLKDGQLRKINLEPVTVSGNGPMRQQLTHAATLLVDRIATTLQGSGENIKPEKQSLPIKPASKAGKGFE
ncbi:MAG: hypothetical protein U9N63_06935 [Pseudomonadota bacterium]|nr:hypothetical protein [Pseudomonadota bacterium]